MPEALRNLSEKAARALRPLDVDTGSNARSVGGCRVHDATMKFQWSEVAATTKTEHLEGPAGKAAARDALWYLKHCEESAYKAEYDGMVKGASVARGLQFVLRAFGAPCAIALKSDASAAMAIASRRGLGKVKCIRACQVWHPEKPGHGDVTVVTVSTGDI